MEQRTNKATSNAYFQKSENRRFTPKYHLKQIKRFSVTTNLLRQTNFDRKVCPSPVLETESPPRPAQGGNREFDYNSPTRKGSLKRRTHNETPRHFHIYQAEIEKRKWKIATEKPDLPACKLFIAFGVHLFYVELFRISRVDRETHWTKNKRITFVPSHIPNQINWFFWHFYRPLR